MSSSQPNWWQKLTAPIELDSATADWMTNNVTGSASPVKTSQATLVDESAEPVRQKNPPISFPTGVDPVDAIKALIDEGDDPVDERLDADKSDIARLVEWVEGNENDAPSFSTPPATPVPEATENPVANPEEKYDMSSLEVAVQKLMEIEGAVGTAIVDTASGMALAQGGNPSFDLGIAAAGNSNIVRAKIGTMRDLGLSEKIEDILITLETQYHLINVLNSADTDGLFIYLALSRASANLALARHKLKAIAAGISV